VRGESVLAHLADGVEQRPHPGMETPDLLVDLLAAGRGEQRALGQWPPRLALRGTIVTAHVDSSQHAAAADARPPPPCGLAHRRVARLTGNLTGRSSS